ncbi:DNA methyltransferase [Corynebacterium phoceense]
MTTAQATDFLKFVDNGQFKDLFEELGWAGIGRGAKTIHVDFGEGREYEAVPVADQSGLRVWVVESERLADASEQRAIDAEVQKVSQVHLLIFTDGINQSWRWPRRGATAATNKRLLHHHYRVGDEEMGMDLQRRLEMIELPVGKKLGILEIQELMAAAFNEEAVKRSHEASQYMQVMNQQLLDCGCNTEEASSLLVRLLFLFFGDDTEMWPDDTFKKWVLNHTTAADIHVKLKELFGVLCDPELDEALAKPPAGKYADTEYVNFRRIDGMYKEPVDLPELSEDFRQQVLKASDFDWGKVNPDIFGAMFQQLVDLDELRRNGEHYTSEENIMKVIEPMFLDEYRQRFEDARDNRGQLLKLQDEMATLQFLDPACGCGNFLIQAYKHLRGLEYEIIKRAEELERDEINAFLDEVKAEGKRNSEKQRRMRDRLQEIEDGGAIHFDQSVLRKSKLSMQQFHGIEINQWPAKVASTAMLLVDHLCNQVWGNSVVRLPITETPEVRCANALAFDWRELIPRGEGKTFVFGNPPFIGQANKSPQQRQDMQRVWGEKYEGYLDYVTSWHAQSLKFFEDREGEFAFVTTNSITQGISVALLFGPIFDAGWKVKFAHRTFSWATESQRKAAVHCVIVGFTRAKEFVPKLWEYVHSQGQPVALPVKTQINPYLMDGSTIVVKKASHPISPELTEAQRGSQPTDGGNLIVGPEDYDAVASDEIAAKYLRPFRMGRELVRGLDRWCLWMATEDFDPEDIEKSPVLAERVTAVRDTRKRSTKLATQKSASTPHLFQENRQPDFDYVGIPSVVTEDRAFYTVQHLSKDVIAGNKVYVAKDPTGLLFALISSSMFITWQKSVGGRLKSDLNFSNQLTWNTFPVPALSEEQRQGIVEAGKRIIEARRKYPERSLADLYRSDAMEPELIAAHDALDEEVDKAFGAPGRLTTERERQELLFASYSKLIAEEKAEAAKKPAKKKRTMKKK